MNQYGNLLCIVENFFFEPHVYAKPRFDSPLSIFYDKKKCRYKLLGFTVTISLAFIIRFEKIYLVYTPTEVVSLKIIVTRSKQPFEEIITITKNGLVRRPIKIQSCYHHIFISV